MRSDPRHLSASQGSPKPPLEWRRGLAWWLAAALAAGTATVASFRYLGFGWQSLVAPWSGHTLMRFWLEFFPPDMSPAFLRQAALAALQTLAVSAVGTALAALAGAVLSLPAAGRWGAVAKPSARAVLNAMRSIPELVWAVFAVLAAGLGPMAGALALAAHTTGVLGRLYGETLENLPPEPERALRQAGAGPLTSWAYAALPQAAPQWLGYTLYRWEMNIRAAAVLGFVGAGGLGQMLYFHLALFQQRQAATVLLAMFALVLLVDSTSGALRARLVR